jgi:hypothetical protein
MGRAQTMQVLSVIGLARRYVVGLANGCHPPKPSGGQRRADPPFPSTAGRRLFGHGSGPRSTSAAAGCSSADGSGTGRSARRSRATVAATCRSRRDSHADRARRGRVGRLLRDAVRCAAGLAGPAVAPAGLRCRHSRDLGSGESPPEPAWSRSPPISPLANGLLACEIRRATYGEFISASRTSTVTSCMNFRRSRRPVGDGLCGDGLCAAVVNRRAVLVGLTQENPLGRISLTAGKGTRPAQSGGCVLTRSAHTDRANQGASGGSRSSARFTRLRRREGGSAIERTRGRRAYTSRFHGNSRTGNRRAPRRG